MHPDVPEWARAILERELADVALDEFHVLKDGPLQKIALGISADATYVVQRTVAGGELYRVAHVDATPPTPEGAMPAFAPLEARERRADEARALDDLAE